MLLEEVRTRKGIVVVFAQHSFSYTFLLLTSA